MNKHSCLAYLRDGQRAYSGEDVGYRILLFHDQDELEIDACNGSLFFWTYYDQVRIPAIGSIPKLKGFSGEYDVDVYITCGLAPWPDF